MTNVKIEVFPEMSNPNNSRNRSQETAERSVTCPEEGCTKRGVLRAIGIHWNEKHSVRKQVLAMKCSGWVHVVLL